MGDIFHGRTREQLIESEMARIGRSDKNEDGKPRSLSGLAFSGGGIRSASFSLGVAQALEEKGLLNRLDYLSTVSGGGYTGSALTWLRHADWSGSGLRPKLLESLRPDGKPVAPDAPAFPMVLERFADFLRSRGNYLDPNQRLNALSLVAVVLRTMVINLSLFGGVVVLALAALHSLWPDSFLLAVPFALGLLVLMAGAWLLFAAMTGLSVGSVQVSITNDGAPPAGTSRLTRRYLLRIREQIWSGRMLGLVLGLLLVGSLPLVERLLGTWWADAWAQGAIGFLGVVAGGIQAVAQFLKQQKGDDKSGILTGDVAVVAASGAVLYGLLLFADWVSILLVEDGADRLPWVIGLGVVVVLVGWLANINLVTPHRMYRDRLMEAFMPNPAAMLEKASIPATEADVAPLTAMCDGLGPLHLVNTNLILVDSKNTLYRGRGGDNFVLSPVLCGGDALGWADSGKFAGLGGDGLTLATAMAISGAAVNAHSGSDGQGPTRNAMVSMLLTLFGLQLGCWVSREGCTQAKPNFFRPGWRGLLGGGFREDAGFLQLSDGGHFENLALYELVRRRLKTIVVVDGGADPTYQFADLGNAVERVFADFGAVVSFEDGQSSAMGDLVPAVGPGYPALLGLSSRGWIKGTITYADDSVADLYYVKAAVVQGLPNSIYAYKAANPSFPNQSTADQFFDEPQLEAYRRLGYEVALSLAGQLAQVLPVSPATAQRCV